MLPYLLPSLAAFLTATLTFFSGFGLGTVLLPVFALFFPLEAAIGLVAGVHLANNLFNLALLGSFLGRRLLTKVTMRFVQATVAALLVLVALGLASGLI